MTRVETAIVRPPGAGPTSLVRLAGRSLIDRALDRFAEASLSRVLLEADAMTRQHLAARPDGPELIFLPRPANLRRAVTEAGIAADAAVFLLDGDVAWFDGPAPALGRMASALAAGAFDAVLLLVRATDSGAPGGREALALDPLGIVARPREHEIAPFLFAGLQVGRPDLLDTAAWDQAIARGRLGGLVHDGIWFDLATARAAAEAEASFEDRLSGVRP